ncbi:MAG: mechanosensitive ion channel family protein [Alsobacter sp.]
MLLFRAALVVFALLACGLAGRAETAPPSLPQGFTQQQFDDLVEAISRSVASKLKAEQAAPGKAGTKETAAREAGSKEAHGKEAAAETGDDNSFAAGVATFIDRAEADLKAAPDLFGTYAKVPAALDRSAEGGPGVFMFLLMLAFSIALALAAERIVDAVLMGARKRTVVGALPEKGPQSLLYLVVLALMDLAGLAAMWLVVNGLTGAWFNEADPQSRLGAGVLASVFNWRLYMFAFRVVLRPGTPEARLAPMSDEQAGAVYRRIAGVVVAILVLRIVLRIAIALKAPQEAVAFGQLIGNAGLLWAFLWACYRSRDAVASWFTEIAGESALGRVLARNWLVIAVPFFCALVAAQVFGAVMARFAIPAAMLLTLNTVLGWIVLRTLIEAVLRRVARAGEKRKPGEMTIFDLFARCLNVALLIGAGILIAQTWIVDVFGLVDANGWRALTRSSITAGVTLFLAYVGFELVTFVTKRYGVQAAAPGAPADEDVANTTASRLATLMPLTRIALIIVIFVTALLIVLSEWGVNITPLIAGASVFGLALSFGSQTLVRDIVSGVFYLADDAFRVGEYIDCGKAKGTVEGFTLRSIRLRHQNGQVHTIPFGQLGQVTNFSRDWTTVKFNLRFARDTDVEKLRKTVKKIGQEMLEDPEMKDEFLEPLKMQGVADILDNALVCRFKFTVKPGKPSYVQREAVKRMVRVFPSVGIEFANSLISVQAMDKHLDPTVAGAAVQSTLQRVQAEAAATTS